MMMMISKKLASYIIFKLVLPSTSLNIFLTFAMIVSEGLGGKSFVYMENKITIMLH